MEMKDSIVESVRQDLLDRSEVGIKKYNTTLDREDLDLFDWIEHTRQELLDGALYLTRAKKDVEEMNDSWDELVREYFKLKQEFELKNKIIDNLVKVIKSQEEEIAELNKANYYQQKRRNWHY
jgi:uncharacterized coiled-coil DUF342 family protein